jgi:hypothetical protein
MEKKDLREVMPETAKAIDVFRAAFGAKEVNPAIRASMAGEAGYFFAAEKGQRFGTPDLRCKWSVRQGKGGSAYAIESDWIFVARCVARSRGLSLAPLLKPSGDSEAAWLDAERTNIKTAIQAAEIYLSATDEEMYLATMINRDDYQ